MFDEERTDMWVEEMRDERGWEWDEIRELLAGAREEEGSFQESDSDR